MYMYRRDCLTVTKETHTDIDDGKDEVEQCFKLFLPPPALRDHPVQCVQCVLANGGQQAVKYLCVCVCVCVITQ